MAAIVNDINSSFVTWTDDILGLNIYEEPVLKIEAKDGKTDMPIPSEDVLSLDNAIPAQMEVQKSYKRSLSPTQAPSFPSKHSKSKLIGHPAKQLKEKAEFTTIQPFDYSAALEKKRLEKTKEEHDRVLLKSTKEHAPVQTESWKTRRLSVKPSSGSRSVSFKK
jgi:hypothetical protein